LVGDALDAVMPRRDDEADRAGVDMAEDVTADLLIARTHVAARPATDAAQRVPGERVVAHRGPTVVEEHEVQLLWPVHPDLRLELDVGCDRMSDNLTEKLRDLFSRLVDRRRDEMRRALSRELDDPLAEISLDRVDPLRLEVIGQADLLRRHRLRLDHELRFLRAADR